MLIGLMDFHLHHSLPMTLPPHYHLQDRHNQGSQPPTNIRRLLTPLLPLMSCLPLLPPTTAPQLLRRRTLHLINCMMTMGLLWPLWPPRLTHLTTQNSFPAILISTLLETNHFRRIALNLQNPHITPLKGHLITLLLFLSNLQAILRSINQMQQVPLRLITVSQLTLRIMRSSRTSMERLKPLSLNLMTRQTLPSKVRCPWPPWTT